jgi:small subunit ribosomal protein S17
MTKEITKEESSSAFTRKKRIGTVVSDKMDKTVVVEIVTLKTHPIYRKKYKSSKRYKAHDEKNEFKVGDKVSIVECKPLSRDKRWIASSAK